MAAGEYISVSSQRELLGAAAPDPAASAALPDLDLNANELALVYRARGMSHVDALVTASQVIQRVKATGNDTQTGGLSTVIDGDDHEAVGSAIGAAGSSFVFFASGAVIPVLPWVFGLNESAAVLTALVLVGIALVVTGSIVGLLSGASPLWRGLRQLAIGLSAAAVTYGLGLLFGATVG